MHTYKIRNKKNIFVQPHRTKMACQNIFTMEQNCIMTYHYPSKILLMQKSLKQKLQIFFWIRLTIQLMTLYFLIEYYYILYLSFQVLFAKGRVVNSFVRQFSIHQFGSEQNPKAMVKLDKPIAPTQHTIEKYMQIVLKSFFLSTISCQVDGWTSPAISNYQTVLCSF